MAVFSVVGLQAGKRTLDICRAKQCLFALVCLLAINLWSAEPELRLDLGLSSDGLGKASLGSVLWGFSSDQLSARLRLLNLDFAGGKGIDPSLFQLELRSPILELGAFAPPDAWQCLSGSRSALSEMLPPLIQNFTDTAVYTKDLPLKFSSLSCSDPVRSWGGGIGIPDYLSAMVFHQISGEDAGWTHAGILGQVPIPINLLANPEDRFLVRIGFAWYFSRFFPPLDSPWQFDPNLPGILRKDSPDWWGDDWQFPGSLQHGQCMVSLSNQNLRWVVLLQASVPRLMDTGWYGATALDWRIHAENGRRLGEVQLAAFSLDPAYRDARGDMPSDSLGFSLSGDCNPSPDWSLQAAAGYTASRRPLASSEVSKFVPIKWSWQTGFRYLSYRDNFGLDVSETQTRNEWGAWAGEQEITLKAGSEGKGDSHGRASASLGLACVAGQAKFLLGQTDLALYFRISQWVVNLGLSGGGTWEIAGTSDWLKPQLDLNFRLEYRLKSGSFLQLQCGVGLPSVASYTELLLKVKADWWAGLAKTVSINLNY